MASSLSSADPSRSAPLQTDSPCKAQRVAGVRLKLFVGESAIGVGQIDLLDCIGQTGSLAHPLVALASKGEKALQAAALGAALIQRYRVHDSHIQTISAELKDWLPKQQVSL